MAQQYNYPTGNSQTDQETPPNVPEDFDFTSFLLHSRPQVPSTTTDRTVPDDGWPQRVQDMKQTGNSASSPYGLPNAYSGWSPMGTERTDFGGIGNGGTGPTTSMYGSSFWMPSEGNSVYHGANPSYNPTNLGYAGSSSDFENNLRGIWGNDGMLGGRMRSNSSAAASEGRDMYEYAWNEWERPHVDSSNATNPAANANLSKQQDATPSTTPGNGKYGENDVEELRAAFFGGNRTERGESSVSVHSSTSLQSKGNTSAKDGCSISSKSYSDIMKESKPPNKMQAVRPPKVKGQKAQQPSGKAKPQNSGFQTSPTSKVSPPPGFESSTLHMPKGPETEYGLDDFIGTSAKVQRWLQQSQTQSEGVEEDPASSKRKKSKKKKKTKKPDPLSGSVASFIRDWNSETTESTDPSSLDDFKNKVPPCAKTAAASPSKLGDTSDSSTAAFGSAQTHKTEANIQDIPMKKEQKAFFDPKRIFKETSPTKKSEEKTQTSPPSKGSSNRAQNFFDPKRIFQSKTPVRNDDVKQRKDSDDVIRQSMKSSTSAKDKRKSSSDRIHNSEQTFQEQQENLARRSSSQTDTPATNHIDKGKHTTSTPVEELHHSTASTQDFASPLSGGNWRHYLNASGDNKGSIKNKGSAYNSSSPGVESPDRGEGRRESSSMGGSRARPDMSSSTSQNAKPRSTPSSFQHYQKESSSPKEKQEEEEMRTRSQSRREAEQAAFDHQHHHFVPGRSGDNIHIHTSNRQSFSPNHSNDCSTTRQSFSPHNHDFSTSRQSFTPQSQDFSSARSSKSSIKHQRNFSFDHDEDENDNTKDYPGSSCNHGIPRTERSSRKHTSASSTSSKHPGKSQRESEPGWKKNKTSKNVRSEARGSRHGREKREFPRHHDSPAGGADCNGSTKFSRHARDGKDKMGRNRQDSDGTSSETAAHYYDGKKKYLFSILISCKKLSVALFQHVFMII